MTALRLAFGFLLQMIPCAIICYLPFLTELKISIKRLTIIIIAVFAVLALVFSLTSLYLQSIYSGADVLNFNINMVFMSYLLVCAVIFFATLKISLPKKIFAFILYANYGLIISSASNIFATLCVKISDSSYDGLPYDWRALIFITTATFITMPVFIKLIKYLRNVFYKVSNKIWISASVITFIYFLNFSFGMMSLNFSIYLGFMVIDMLICLSLGDAAIYYFIFRLLNEMIKNTETERITDAIRYHSQLQSVQFKQIQSNLEIARKAHHDFKHILHTLAGFAVEGNIEQIKSYLNDYIKQLPNISLQNICDNPSVNALLQYYVSITQNYCIDFNFRLDIPAEISIPSVDICVVLGNLLENAVDACNNMASDKKPFITLNIVQLKNVIAITLDNNFSGNINIIDGKYLSTKENGTGLGLSSVESIASKYNGGVSFENDKDIFRASVILINE